MSDGNWIQTDPKKGWFMILRLYSPLEPFFTKTVAAERNRTRDNTDSSHTTCNGEIRP